MEELINKGAKSWCRFVIDTCVIVKLEENAKKFVDYLIKQHSKIKFTLETEKDNTLSFKEIKIKKKII